jgi:hypothetical protein
VGKLRKREKNGRLQRPSAAERREAQKAREFAEQLTVLNQPHRRGNPDQMCGDALGRFVLAHRLGREVYDAGQRYSMLVRRFYASRGIPMFMRDRGGSGRGISEAATAAIAEALKEIDGALVKISRPGLSAVRTLCVFENEVAPAVEADAREVLVAPQNFRRL